MRHLSPLTIIMAVAVTINFTDNAESGALDRDAYQPRWSNHEYNEGLDAKEDPCADFLSGQFSFRKGPDGLTMRRFSASSRNVPVERHTFKNRPLPDGIEADILLGEKVVAGHPIEFRASGDIGQSVLTDPTFSQEYADRDCLPSKK